MHRPGCTLGSRPSEALAEREKERNICRLCCRVNATYLSLAGAACHGTKIKTRHTRPAHMLARGAQKRSGTDTASTLGLSSSPPLSYSSAAFLISASATPALRLHAFHGSRVPFGSFLLVFTFFARVFRWYICQRSSYRNYSTVTRRGSRWSYQRARMTRSFHNDWRNGRSFCEDVLGIDLAMDRLNWWLIGI